MSVLKYKDPITGEVKTVGSASINMTIDVEGSGIAKEITSQEILTLLNGLTLGGRSTKIHNGSKQCSNNTENTVFEFTGGGKVNRIELNNNVNNGSGGHVSIMVDGVELYRLNSSMSASIYYLFRNNRGALELTTSYSSSVVPLDIEFKNNFKIINYPTNNTPTVTYTVEISEN